MAALNNLQGDVIKDGKVLYKEKIKDGMYVMVVCLYQGKYEGKNNWRHESSRMFIQAFVSNGDSHTHSNGVTSLTDWYEHENVFNQKDFKLLEEPFTTEQGFIITQYSDGTHNYLKDNEIVYTRTLKYTVEIPKEFLINLLK
jgi:hypothetical protein